MTQTIRLDTRILDKIAASLDKNRDDILMSLAFEVEQGAKQTVPVDTGALRSSIYVEGKNSSGFTGQGERLPTPSGNIVANVGPTMEYGAYVELGTYKMGACPYLLPAVEHAAQRLNSNALWSPMFAEADKAASAAMPASEFIGE